MPRHEMRIFNGPGVARATLEHVSGLVHTRVPFVYWGCVNYNPGISNTVLKRNGLVRRNEGLLQTLSEHYASERLQSAIDGAAQK